MHFHSISCRRTRAATSAVGGGARPITSIAWVEEAVPATFITVWRFVFLAQSQDARSCSLRCYEMYLPQRQSRKPSLAAMNHVEIPMY